MEHIGQGSFGTVYVASWGGSLVAAKIIPAQLSEAATVRGEISVLK